MTKPLTPEERAWLNRRRYDRARRADFHQDFRGNVFLFIAVVVFIVIVVAR